MSRTFILLMVLLLVLAGALAFWVSLRQSTPSSAILFGLAYAQ